MGSLVIRPAIGEADGEIVSMSGLIKFSQHQAVATSLAIMLPPVTFFAVWEYYKKGWVDIKIACVLVLLMLIFSYLASLIAKNLDALQMYLF